jgi:SSU ribosomal protein S17E
MGRIKTKMVKSVTEDLFEYYDDEFTDEFETNKKVVETYLDGASKTLRNTIAGYATRLKRRDNERARN